MRATLAAYQSELGLCPARLSHETGSAYTMTLLLRILTRAAEILISVPLLASRFLVEWVAFNPRLGFVRYIALGTLGYLAFAVVLVYILAPLRGITGQAYLSDKLRYDAERWLATAIYDSKGNFVGTFDPRLDSRRDVNYTDAAIEVGDYTANPDHKSIPVRETPPHYWNCLVYHEDRYLGGPLNPYGIDLLGVLKIPYTTVKRSIALKRLSLGVGGSTLPMQFARVIYKTPPSSSEGGLTKLRRKIGEWWLAPVIYQELTRGGDDTRLKQWAANHIWLAQRTGGQPLHGVEVTSRIVFGKEAKDLSIAEQYVLASAVNKPIILLEGSEKLNEVRLDRWRYITEVRARTCAEKLITDEAEQKKIVFELVNLAGGPPDPKVKPKLQEALERHAPDMAKRAQANPITRANALMPSARFGLREEMKQVYGFGWRDHVRGVTATFDVVENLAFAERIRAELKKIDLSIAPKLNPGFVLDPAKVKGDVRSPDVIVVAATEKGEIVRYFEAGDNASYFGSPFARSALTGTYEAGRESRMIASTGKILAAIAIGNEGKDSAGSLYLDTEAPARGLETCDRNGTERHGRKAIVAFACSLNGPLLNRAALAGQDQMAKLINGFGFVMPPSGAAGEGTPPSTAAVLGQISGSPRRVHQMASVLLGALIGKGGQPVKPPSLIKAYDYTNRQTAVSAIGPAGSEIVPNTLIRRGAHNFLKAMLEAPLCYTSNGTSHGTLKSVSAWCAVRRPDLRLHFAKTGTQVTLDPNATVDTLITGGLQFQNGAAYSYVVLVGTGTPRAPWARSVHAAQAAAPLLDVLLTDLATHAMSNPRPQLLPPKPAAPVPVAQRDDLPALAARKGSGLTPADRQQIFDAN